MNDSLRYLGENPLYRQHHHGKLTFSLMYAFSENYVLPISHDEVVHGKGSLLSKSPGNRSEQVATLRAFLAYMWATPASSCSSWAASSARSRVGRGAQPRLVAARPAAALPGAQPRQGPQPRLPRAPGAVGARLPAVRLPVARRRRRHRQHLLVAALRRAVRAEDAPVVACVVNFGGETQEWLPRRASRAAGSGGSCSTRPATTSTARRASTGSSSRPSRRRGTTSRSTPPCGSPG